MNNKKCGCIAWMMCGFVLSFGLNAGLAQIAFQRDVIVSDIACVYCKIADGGAGVVHLAAVQSRSPRYWRWDSVEGFVVEDEAIGGIDWTGIAVAPDGEVRSASAPEYGVNKITKYVRVGQADWSASWSGYYGQGYTSPRSFLVSPVSGLSAILFEENEREGAETRHLTVAYETDLDEWESLRLNDGAVFAMPAADAAYAPCGSLYVAYTLSDNKCYVEKIVDGESVQRVEVGPSHQYRWPAICSDVNGVLHLVVSASGSGSQDLYHVRSMDGGLTWSDPVVVSAASQAYYQRLSIAVCPLRPSRIAAICRDGDSLMKALAVSEDGGATWTVQTLPGGNDRSDNASVIFDMAGTLYVFYPQDGDDGDGKTHMLIHRLPPPSGTVIYIR